MIADWTHERKYHAETKRKSREGTPGHECVPLYSNGKLHGVPVIAVEPCVGFVTHVWAPASPTSNNISFMVFEFWSFDCEFS